MDQFIDLLGSNFASILGTVLTAILGYLGMQIKSMIQKTMNDKKKEQIIASTVNYVEQISKKSDMDNAEKFDEAKQKAASWLREAGIKYSDTELEILLECAVKHLKQAD